MGLMTLFRKVKINYPVATFSLYHVSVKMSMRNFRKEHGNFDIIKNRFLSQSHVPPPRGGGGGGGERTRNRLLPTASPRTSPNPSLVLVGVSRARLVAFISTLDATAKTSYTHNEVRGIPTQRSGNYHAANHGLNGHKTLYLTLWFGR